MERVIVATGTTGDGTEIGRYGSLNEAMAAAATYSAENTTPVTIHILQNLDVEPEDYGGAGAIILDKEGADIILDATAPNGEQYEINGHEKYVMTSDGYMKKGWNLIGVEKGKLTILSGIYQAKETAVYLGYNCPGKIQLKGGTYLQGTYATVNNVDGACASYITRPEGIESAGLRSLIATGYYMQLNRPNHEKNQPNMMDEEIVSHLTPVSVASGSGTVYKCNHENLGEVVPARETTCTINGYPSYQLCQQCGAAFYEENGETIMSTVEEITIPARGHDYVTDDEEGEDAVYYCRYCDQPARAVTASCKVVNRQTGKTIEAEGLDCNEVGFKDFFDAWNVRGSFISYANTFTNGKIDQYDESIKIITTYTLHTDLDYTGVEGKHLIDMCLWHDYIIDLNGHDLNLGNYMLRTTNDYRYPGKDALIIRDSQKAGKSITAKINTNGGMAYDPEEPSFMSKKNLILEDVTLKTSFLYDAKDLLLNEGAGIIFLENCREYLGVLTMTTGSFLEGYGISHISFKTGAPQSANLAKALHNAKYYTIHDGNMEEISGIGSSTFTGSYLNLYMPDGSPVNPANIWHITVPEGDVTHEFKDRLADKDRYHSGLCTHCGMNVQGEHIYANHACVLCLHRPEAYAVVEGITSDHTTLASAIETAQGKKGTIVLTQDLRSNIKLSDGTQLTLDLNGHKITSQGACGIYVDGAELTIIDSSESNGEIENTDAIGSCVVVSNKSNNSLTIMDGNYTAKDGAVIINAAQINTEGYPSVYIYGGSYTSIRTGSMESDVMEMLGTDCYFRSTEDDHLVNVSTNGQGYQYVENVYAYNSDMKLKQNQTVQIDNQTSASAEDCNTIIAEAVRNINVNSFGQTNISQAVDLSNILLISDLQRAVSAAGIEKMLTLSENIQAYVEAKLMATTIESVQVIGSAKDTRVQAMTRMTFDVNPYAYMNIDGTIVATPIDPEMVTEDVTFRLPVDSRYEVAFLQVYYTDKEGINTYIGNYPVQNSLTAGDNISKYIEIESNKFGTYEYSVVNTYTLADAETFVNPGTTVMENVSYTRTFATAGEWEALYIPLSISPAAEYDIADIFTFGNMVDTNGDGQINEEDEVVLIIDKLEADDVTEPNAPYLIRATETGEVTIASVDNILYGAEPFNGSCSTTRTKYTFQGSYREMEFYGTNENFSLQEGAVKSEQDILAPQRWFIQMSSLTPSFNPEIAQAQSAGIRVFSIGEELDRETAIRLLQGETIDVWKNGKRYTLDGRRAVGSTRGIQIINNKKVIEK